MSNPTLFLYTGNGSLAFLDRAGGGTLTGSGAVRYAPASGALVNHCQNPKLQAGGTTGVARGSASITYGSTESVLAGDGGLKVVAPGSITGEGASLPISRNVVSGGESWSVTFQVYCDQSVTVQHGIEWFTAASGYVSGSYANTTVPAATWTDLSTTATAATGAHRIHAMVQTVTTVQARTIYVRRVIYTRGSSVESWFDPATGVWLDPLTGILGTANASPSVSQAVAWVEEGTTNRILNPWASSNVSNITATGSTRTRVTTYAYIGSASVQVVTNNSVSGEGIYFTSGTGLSLTGARTLIPSIYVRGGGTLRVNVQILYTDLTSDSSTWAGSAAFGTMTDAWTRLVGDSIAANAAKTINEVRLYIVTKDTAQAATFYVANAQIEDKAYATSYCDGSLGTGYAWSGTAHASSSTRTATVLSRTASSHVRLGGGALVARASRAYDPNLDQYIHHLFNSSDGRIYLLVSSDAWAGRIGAHAGVSSGVTATVGQWYVPCVEWDGDSYIVRELASGGASSDTAYTGNSSVGTTGYIGGNNTNNIFNGYIGPVLIADRPLTANERATLNARTAWGWRTLKGGSVGRLTPF